MENEKRLIWDEDAKRHLIALAVGHHTEVLHIDMILNAILHHTPTVDAVEVPCKMGDIVWGIQKHIRGQQAKQGVVNQMYFGEDMRLCICVKNVCRGEWGKNVFAKKEEAETALAKMDGGNEDG